MKNTTQKSRVKVCLPVDQKRHFSVSIGNFQFSTDKKKKTSNRTYTYPPIRNSVIKHINSFTSIHCGMAGLSWSTFEMTPNEQTKMTHWDWRPLTESKLNLYQLATFMTNTFKDVPQSDFFVFENPIASVVGSSSKVNLNVQISQMIGMASVIVAQKNALATSEEDGRTPDSMNVAYLRRFLFAR